jgi:hypothetical protein
MRSLQKDDILNSSHHASRAEMIDDKINRLCEETGLIKKRLLSAIGLYPEKWADRLKGRNGLTENERLSLDRLIKDHGAALSRYEVSGDIVSVLDELHDKYYIFKGRLLKPLDTHYHVLQRGGKVSPDRLKILQQEVRRVGKTLSRFTFGASND